MEKDLDMHQYLKKRWILVLINESFCCADAWTTKMLIVKKNLPTSWIIGFHEDEKNNKKYYL